MQAWHIGCSGFHYKEWKGIFYPEKLPVRRWFEYYCTRFNTLELNVTFYRFPQLSALQRWYQVSPDGFSFSVKAPRLITHYKKFVDCSEQLTDFYDTVTEGLAEKLAVVLFQFPPSFAYTPDKLELLLTQLRDGVTNVLEFRHVSWWNNDVFKALEERKLVFSGASHPRLPDEAVITAPVAYYRFHGIPTIYFSSYSDNYLKSVADQLLKSASRKVYVYFNNTATAAAIDNASWLEKYIAGN